MNNFLTIFSNYEKKTKKISEKNFREMTDIHLKTCRLKIFFQLLRQNY